MEKFAAASSEWFKFPFLVDSGADCTVFSADVLDSLELSAEAPLLNWAVSAE